MASFDFNPIADYVVLNSSVLNVVLKMKQMHFLFLRLILQQKIIEIVAIMMSMNMNVQIVDIYLT